MNLKREIKQQQINKYTSMMVLIENIVKCTQYVLSVDCTRISVHFDARCEKLSQIH